MESRQRIIILYDYYGELLSDDSKKYFEDYYFDNYQVKVIYSDNKEEMFEGKNILSGTVLDFD